MPGARPAVIAEISVTAVERLSPSFVRVEFGAPELAHFGVDGPFLDQRIKLVIPAADREPPSLAGGSGHWFERWRAMPEAERGHLRTYSVRAVTGEGAVTRLVVDFVLHLDPGRTGPASRWAARAGVGDRLVLVGPRRGVPWGGIEFAPGEATTVLLAGDETAVPAVSRILADLPAGTRGTALLEVPRGDDVLPVAAPPGVAVRWVPRDGRGHGELLVRAVTAHLGDGPAPRPGTGRDGGAPDGGAPDGRGADPAPDIWETPTYSSSGEVAATASAPGGAPSGPGGVPGLYAWIAGESGMVTRLRRHLVTDLGLDRRQVAFMGYWREGVAAGG